MPTLPNYPGGSWSWPQQEACAPAMDVSRFPVGMGYVPMQNWQQPYCYREGFHRGTIFPELDLPFLCGRCMG